MPARDYSVPPRPSFIPLSLAQPSETASRISARRRLRIQAETDLYARLDSPPYHRLVPCWTVYEVEDRTKPSISSF
jgi:hypothetical protein